MIYFTPAIQNAIKGRLKERFSTSGDLKFQAVGGGSINEAYQINFNHRSFFCKVNSATNFPQLFMQEKAGLELLERQQIINVPKVLDYFETENKQVLLLEWISEGEKTANFWKKFGEQLACLHRKSAEYFGLEENNYMGNVRQRNTQHLDWNQFYATERLLPLIQRCNQKNLINIKHEKLFEKLIFKLSSFFPDEKPSLLHGDLWRGNVMCDHNGEPVLIDPAVYFGHRSIDLGMTALFGGFDRLFYEAYHYHFPFPANYKEQWEICQLYPLLIHLYLFGPGYLPQIEKVLASYS